MKIITTFQFGENFLQFQYPQEPYHFDEFDVADKSHKQGIVFSWIPVVNALLDNKIIRDRWKQIDPKPKL